MHGATVARSHSVSIAVVTAIVLVVVVVVVVIVIVVYGGGVAAVNAAAMLGNSVIVVFREFRVREFGNQISHSNFTPDIATLLAGKRLQIKLSHRTLAEFPKNPLNNLKR